ncbi:VaFE repeat-containing surface-anchored protein [Eubacteriales bacterium OttesenSCG-928-M02]|nr:VaFE repeat-containing surface-anchored protein [Eubacteriales bacterium OttesenSCG-928-M02]
MRKRFKSILGIMLVLAMCFSMMPLSAFAATGETETPAIDQVEEVPSSEIPEESIEIPSETPKPTMPSEATTEETVTPESETVLPEETPQEEVGIMALAANAAQVKHTRSANQIDYGYVTSYYEANGNTAFCLDPNRQGIDTGTYPVSRYLERGTGYNTLIKAAYYLYGGPGYDDIKDELFDDPDDLKTYGLCHATIAYIYLDDQSAFRGLSSSTIEHLLDVVDIIKAQDMPPAGFKVFIYNEGKEDSQPFIGWENTPPGDLEIIKVSSNPTMSEGNDCYSLEGAKFDVFNGSNEKIGSITTDANGKGKLEGIEAGQTGLYIVEVKPPKGFAKNAKKIPFEIVSEETTTVTVSNVPQNDPVGILLRKQDADTSSNTPQGGAALSGAEFTVSYYSGLYESASQLSGVTPARTWVLRTGGNGTAYLLADYLVSGDPFYYATNGDPTLPLGTLTVQETKAPQGYLLNDELFIRQITSEGSAESVFTYNEPIVKEKVARGGVEIEKWDIERDQSKLKQGDATLAGAVLEIYNRGENSVVVNGVEYAPGAVVHTLTTNAEDWAGTSNDLLPYSAYEIVEKTNPTGYLNIGAIRQTFKIRENGVIVRLLASDTVIKNDIIRGGVYLEKWDNETGKHEPQGGATFEGAVFEIINRSADSVLVEGNLYAPGEVVYTMTTNAAGAAITANDLLPYGTYEARESSPPNYGYLATGVLSRTFTIREHGVIVELNTSDTAIRNNPIRGDLKGVKISDGDTRRMANVPFSITSLTTGESHVVVTDANGEFNTSSSWNPHSQDTNRGETDRDGIWFGELETLNDNLGALLYDTYLIEELPCDANKDKELLSFEVSIYRHMTVVDLGTLTNDYIPTPEIFTTAMDEESTTNNAYVSETTTIIDTVYYCGLKVGQEYTVKGILIDKETNAPLLVDGKQVTGEKIFRASAESGTVTMAFTFDSRALNGKAVVVFESLEFEEKEIAVHADIEDEGQTVTFFEPKIGTSASGKNGEKDLDILSEVTIIDTVSYENLIPGETCTLKGILMDKATGEPLLVDGKEVTAETTFKAEQASGTVEVSFTFSSMTLKGKTVVVFESLEHQEKEIAVHADIEDIGQTVTFKAPKIGTSAAGKDGNKVIPLDKEAVIIDTVTYENLTPGETYTLKGVLMNKATGKPVLVDGKEIIAEATFKAEKASGTVEVTFTFDSTTLEGKTLVVFEVLEYQGEEIATHKDISSEEQTITVETKEPPVEKTPPGDTPKTGDDSNIGVWIALMVAALLGAGVLSFFGLKKRKKIEEE